jgi:hypothetical protein
VTRIERRTLIYRGPASGGVALVEILDSLRLTVAYDPPLESRSQIDNPDAVTIFYHCTGPVSSIHAARARFERSGYGRTASLTLDPPGDDAQNGGAGPTLGPCT